MAKTTKKHKTRSTPETESSASVVKKKTRRKKTVRKSDAAAPPPSVLAPPAEPAPRARIEPAEVRTAAVPVIRPPVAVRSKPAEASPFSAGIFDDEPMLETFDSSEEIEAESSHYEQRETSRPEVESREEAPSHEPEEEMPGGPPRERLDDAEGERPGGRRRRRGRRGGRDRNRDRTEGADQPPQRDRVDARGDGRPPARRDEPRHEPAPALAHDEIEEADAGEPPPPTATGRIMLINVYDKDECRIAILNKGRLDELYIERTSSSSNVGNIYKGVVTNVEPSIQAAFVDYGHQANGFLHVSDVHPQYFHTNRRESERVGMKTPRRHRPPIQDCLRRGQEVIVQVIKEGVGTKGPTLSTYLSVPGRFLVLMPGMDQVGVSRKVEDEEQRRAMRDALLALKNLPTDMGVIMRTAGADRTKRDLQNDLNYLTRLWKAVEKRTTEERAPAELYKESDLVIRTIRDVMDSSVDKIVIDDPVVAERVGEFLAIANPRSKDMVEHYADHEPLFYRYDVESEIDKLFSKHVPLPCGGSLVIEQTEALVAIDVNSGKFRIPDNAEQTAYQVNKEAVDEIARQLRLRDLGGLVICDLIDMMNEKHKRDIERRLSDNLKVHKERAKCLRTSAFGIIEMTRQRQRPSFSKKLFQECQHCHGNGKIKTIESLSLEVMRKIRKASRQELVSQIDVKVPIPLANDLLNRKRKELTDLEHASGQSIRLYGAEEFGANDLEIHCIDARGRLIHAQSTVSTAAGSAPALAGAQPRSDAGAGDDRKRRGNGRQRRGRKR